MNKKIILAIIITLLLGTGVYFGFLRKEKTTFSLVEIVRGDIIQQVSETGKVVKGEEIELSFKTAGRIEKIYTKAGEQVKSGDVLAKLDTSDLEIQLQEARASLSVARAKLSKLLAGSSPEEIQIAKTNVANAKISLESGQQNLKDVQDVAEENLSSTCEDAQNTLDDAYLKSYNAFNVAALIQRTYFTSNDQESIKIKDNKDIIENALSKVKSSLDTAKKANSKEEDIDVGLSETKDELEEISLSLKIIREICEEPIYRSVVSSTDKTSLDNQRTYIITTLTNVVNSQQTISSTKLTNRTNINTTQAEVETKEGKLKAAEDELAKISAPPRKEDIDLYGAQLKQTQAQVELLENQTKEAVLKSPIAGQITKIKKRIGEIVQPTSQDVILTLLPLVPFEIKVDIYEEDVVKLNVGQDVDISLISFPVKIFKGKVVSIEPAEKIIENVVYYEATINFDISTGSVSTLNEAEWVEELADGIKPGMTADVVITTASKENVLIIPEGTIQEKEGKTIVEVLRNGKTEEREIEIGLQGRDNRVEVISGLKEGELLILPR